MASRRGWTEATLNLAGVEPTMLLVRVLDLVGTFLFATSGAALAARKEVDLFGVLVLAFVTAVVGGYAHTGSGQPGAAPVMDGWASSSKVDGCLLCGLAEAG